MFFTTGAIKENGGKNMSRELDRWSSNPTGLTCDAGSDVYQMLPSFIFILALQLPWPKHVLGT